MKKPNTIEKEIDEIRVRLYEEIKGMSPAEMNAYLRAQVAPIEKEFGIKAVSRSKIDERRAAL